MQNQYVGDIGDYAKYGLLRELLDHEIRCLGVNWHLHPDETRKADGRFVEYLEDRDQWGSHDPELFDCLSALVKGGRRCVGAIEEECVLKDAVFAGHEMRDFRSKPKRSEFREQWLLTIEASLKGCDAVFVDPDNGLYEASKPDWSEDTMWKRILPSEAKRLARSSAACPRTLIVYHHNTRRKGGHAKEVDYWKGKLGSDTLAVRWRGRSPRTFFVVNPQQGMCSRLNDFMARWNRNRPKSRLLWTPG